DILLIIAEGKKIIITCILVCLIAGLGYALFLNKPEYASSMQIAAITQNSPKTGDFNIYVSGNLISGILTSDSVLDSVIDQNDLLKNEDGTAKTRVQARKSLSDSIEPNVDAKSGIVTVKVKNSSPEKALTVAKSLYDSSLEILQEMGMTISGQKDTYIQSEIEKNIEKIEEFKQDTANGVVHKDIDQLLKTLSLLSLYEEGAVYRKSAPMVIQLVSPPTLPDQPLPRGRGKIAALSGILGLFVGLTFAFISHFLRVSSSDPETAQKVKRLKELAGFKRERAN
ncbi:MAG: Wzz/FepE/Etk N-terminal domain-containing protein, partial [Synergistaceae bacterium]|nr:Wzz/FepE/Etk N-terminal domain-containing protein [Synergistaceae bacterium]